MAMPWKIPIPSIIVPPSRCSNPLQGKRECMGSWDSIKSLLERIKSTELLDNEDSDSDEKSSQASTRYKDLNYKFQALKLRFNTMSLQDPQKQDPPQGLEETKLILENLVELQEKDFSQVEGSDVLKHSFDTCSKLVDVTGEVTAAEMD